MVVAVVALFVALGGSSYAALRIGSAQILDDSIRGRDVHTNTLHGKDIRNNTLRSQDLRNNDVRSKDIRNSTITGRDVGLNALGGSDVNESSLGTVPRAGSLDGIDSSGFVQGPGIVRSGGREVPSPSTVTFLSVPGLLEIEGDCNGSRTLRYRNLGGQSHFVREGNGNDDDGSFGTNGTDEDTDSGSPLRVTWQVRDDATGRVTTVIASAASTTGGCLFVAQAVSGTG
jgi:hypothetical protein